MESQVNHHLLSREEILHAQDLTTETVHVPEWGGTVNVRSLTGKERDRFEAESVLKKGKSYETNLRNLRARLVAITSVDDAGNRIFSDADVEALGEKNAAALDRVFTVARRLSGLTTEDVEDLAKNSESGQSEDSISDSPSLSA